MAGSSEFGPEDWIASATPRFGRGDDGLTTMPDGRYLRDVIDTDAGSWLGPEHVEYFGPDPALLVKLLDAGQRLPVHVHPPRLRRQPSWVAPWKNRSLGGARDKRGGAGGLCWLATRRRAAGALSSGGSTRHGGAARSAEQANGRAGRRCPCPRRDCSCDRGRCLFS